MVWVYCDDDRLWWPAVVLTPHVDYDPLVLWGHYDAAVRMFHDKESIFPVTTTDPDLVALMEWDRFESSSAASELVDEGTTLFRQPSIGRALQEARTYFLAQQQQQRLLNPDAAVGAPVVAAAPSPEGDLSLTTYSEEERRKMAEYLGAIDSTAAEALQAQLLAKKTPTARKAKEKQEKQKKEKKTRKLKEERKPLTESGGLLPDPSSVPLPSADWAPGGGPQGEEVVPPPQRREEDPQADRNHEPVGDDDVVLDAECLSVLEQCVFQQRDSLPLLDPNLRFEQLLGAVRVDSQDLKCTLPTVNYFHQGAPQPQERTVLLALSDDYRHDVGWPEIVPLDDGDQLEMKLWINNVAVSLPKNWNTTAAMQQTAIRTAIPLDITDVIAQTLPEEEGLQLELRFSHPKSELFTWGGIIAAIAVRQVDLAVLCDQMLRNYSLSRATPPVSNTHERADGSTSTTTTTTRKRERNTAAIAVLSESVKVTCVITSLRMSIPCRGRQCDHLQCVDLHALLTLNCQRHVWVCPWCRGPLPFHDIVIDYPLYEILRASKSQAIDCVVINRSASTPVYKVELQKRIQRTESMVDDDD